MRRLFACARPAWCSLDEAAGSPDPRAAVFQRVSRDDLALAVQRVGELAREADDRSYYAELLGRYSLVRRFLPTLLHTIIFESTEAGKPVLEALACLRRSEGSRAPRLRERPWRLSPDPGTDSSSGRTAAWIGGSTLSVRWSGSRMRSTDARSSSPPASAGATHAPGSSRVLPGLTCGPTSAAR